MGQNYFVLLCNSQVEIIAEDADGYVAVYAIVPGSVDAPGIARRAFPRYVALLKDTLTGLIDSRYAGRIYRQNRHIALDCGAVFGHALGCICLDTGEEFYVR